MKIKSLLASLAACAIAVSAMAVTAAADITNANSDDKYMIDISEALPSGKTLADVYGVKATFEGKPGDGESNVGAICWNSDSTGWKQKEFGAAEGEKELTIDSDNAVTLLNSEAIFTADDTWGQFFVAQWHWDGDTQINFSVKSMELLGQDGKPLSGAAEESSQQTEESSQQAEESSQQAEESSQQAGNTGNTGNTGSTQTSGTNTGDAGVGMAVAGLALAGAAAIAARKKH